MRASRCDVVGIHADAQPERKKHPRAIGSSRHGVSTQSPDMGAATTALYDSRLPPKARARLAQALGPANEKEGPISRLLFDETSRAARTRIRPPEARQPSFRRTDEARVYQATVHGEEPTVSYPNNQE